jgi:hypothetical protein
MKNKPIFKWQFALVFLLNFTFSSIESQIESSYSQTNERPTAKANYFENDISIDGDVLNDPVWQIIEPFGDMTQKQPNSGEKSTEKTEIRIAYSNQFFYLAVVCHDSAPDKLVVSDSRRDSDLSNTDAFLFILDTYNDGQNGFMFGTNSIGVEYDAQIDNEGQGNLNPNRQQGGMIGGTNLNWDASWQVKTMVGDFGWSAEFAIPLKTLRFKAGDDRTWGVNFQRNIQKANEISYWASLPLEFSLARLSLAGKLENLNLKKPGNLKFIPYVLSSIANTKANGESETVKDYEIGGDIKYSITPSITLDLTYNTDFAQVEVDEQQINLDRFNLFFPEKRPFFLENAGLFSVGSPGEVDLFFSRRIGIGTNGEKVPIIGGARVSGKVNNTSIGALTMFTDEVEETSITKEVFNVARVNHEFEGRSSVGGMFVNKSGIGDMSPGSNNTFAIDGKLGLGKKAQLSGFVAKSSSDGDFSNEYSFKLKADYEWNGWRLNAGYTELGEGFNPEVGFLGRTAFRKPEFLIFKTIRAPESSNFLENRPHISYRGYWDFEGFLETSFLHIDNHWVWKSLNEVHTGINIKTEGLTEEFEISDGVIIPEGTYNHAEAQLVFSTNSNKPVSISTRHVLGGYFGGKRYTNSGTLSVRVGNKFTSSWGVIHNIIRLPYGDFDSSVLRARLSYSFTPSLYIQSLIQRNSVSDSWSVNARFGWIQQANTGLFIVYNETHEESLIETRSVILKYSILLDVLK